MILVTYDSCLNQNDQIQKTVYNLIIAFNFVKNKVKITLAFSEHLNLKKILSH